MTLHCTYSRVRILSSDAETLKDNIDDNHRYRTLHYDFPHAAVRRIAPINMITTFRIYPRPQPISDTFRPPLAHQQSESFEAINRSNRIRRAYLVCFQHFGETLAFGRTSRL